MLAVAALAEKLLAEGPPSQTKVASARAFVAIEGEHAYATALRKIAHLVLTEGITVQHLDLDDVLSGAAVMKIAADEESPMGSALSSNPLAVEARRWASELRKHAADERRAKIASIERELEAEIVAFHEKRANEYAQEGQRRSSGAGGAIAGGLGIAGLGAAGALTYPHIRDAMAGGPTATSATSYPTMGAALEARDGAASEAASYPDVQSALAGHTGPGMLAVPPGPPPLLMHAGGATPIAPDPSIGAPHIPALDSATRDFVSRMHDGAPPVRATDLAGAVGRSMGHDASNASDAVSRAADSAQRGLEHAGHSAEQAAATAGHAGASAGHAASQFGQELADAPRGLPWALHEAGSDAQHATQAGAASLGRAFNGAMDHAGGAVSSALDHAGDSVSSAHEAAMERMRSLLEGADTSAGGSILDHFAGGH